MFNRFAIATAIAFALAACGGGGSGDKMGSMMQKPDGMTDTDGDGVIDSEDAFPRDASETADTDGDGVGDNADAFPQDASASVLSTSTRPSAHEITPVRGNELAIGELSTNWKVENGVFVRSQPRPEGRRWETATDYPVIGIVLPNSSRQLDGDRWDSWYYYGRWSDENIGTLYFGGYQYEFDMLIARFGVTLENDEITSWATGVKPLTDFADNPGIQSLGTANYTGTLVGLTTSTRQPIGSSVDITFNLGPDITGTFELGDLSTIEKDGSFKEFLGGTLRHDIAVKGNTFTTTGGDSGTVTGIFAGERHEAAAGTFQHSAFTGAFSAEDSDAYAQPAEAAAVPAPN